MTLIQPCNNNILWPDVGPFESGVSVERSLVVFNTPDLQVHVEVATSLAAPLFIVLPSIQLPRVIGFGIQVGSYVAFAAPYLICDVSLT